MYLKSLEVQGFKSFPDKTLIRFGDEITAIVGPNGSGKSNISDAILWVMGEQSSKALRGAKMEDVIFGGTQKRPAVGFAEVTLTLDNSDRAMPRDADEVTLTRRYYRSGDSEYYINRQAARLRDINELLMDTGLGREGYANIGQGRIDEILAVKSSDRREIFEEAAGISKYRHRKEDTERKLAATEDNLLRISDKISELELQLEPLKRQSEEARRYLELKDELRGVEVAVWIDSLEKLSTAARKAEEDYNSASFVLQQEHDNLQSLYDLAEKLGSELHARDDELENARVRASMLDAAHQQIDGQIAILQGNVENNRGNIARIEEELQSQDDRNSGLRAQIEQSEQRIREIDDTLKSVREQIDDVNNRIRDAAAQAQGVNRRFLELRGQETQTAADIAAVEADLRSLAESLEKGEEQEKQLREEGEAGKARLEETRRELEQRRIRLAKAKDAAQAAENTIAGFQLRKKMRAERVEKGEESLRALLGELESVSAKARVYRAMERDFESYQKSVRLVMKESQAGRLQNIHGPVSSLIRVEDRLTVATEIALGSAMQYIVVGSEQDGKAALAYLKHTGGGRATVLPLTTISGRKLKETGLESNAGFVGIASELVSCDEKYRGIVDDLLGRTVIVEDMDFAIAMANRYHHRFRIVTLDGQVMNAGGSMTGGSVNREAGILSRANELEKLSAREKTLEEKKTALTGELQEARRQLNEVTFQMDAVSQELRTAEDNVLRLQGEEKQYSVLMEAIAEAAQNAGREQKALEERMNQDRQHDAALRAKQEVFARQLDSIRAELAKAENIQSETVAASNQLTEEMAQLRSTEAALQAERSTAQGHIGELQQLQSAMDGDKEKKSLLIETMQAENSRIEKEIEALVQQRQENDGEIARQKDALNQALSARAKTEAEKTRSERDAQEKNKSILNMERACALLEQKKLTASLEEKQIIDRLWDNYGLTPGTAGEHCGKIESVAAGNRRIGELRRKINQLGTPNLGAIEEFARVNERYTYLCSQRDDVTNAKRELESIIGSITREMTAIFVTEFRKISEWFSKIFEEMFQGGRGQLVLEDPSEPLTCGIEIRVQPPGKQLKTITLLSGGEKAFVAIALYFSILKVRPAPFCFLDEIDAALDERNVERFASYLRNLSSDTQFIVITHRRGTMEAADVLYGVTMQEQGVSKLLRLDLNQMEKTLGIEE